MLTMPTTHADSFLGAIFKSINFRAFGVIHHCDVDFNSAQNGSSNHYVIIIHHKQDAVKAEFFTCLDCQAVHFNGAPFDDAVLLSATFYNCVSHLLFSSHSLRRVPAEFFHSSPANGEAGGFTNNRLSIFKSAEAEADEIILAGWGCVNRHVKFQNGSRSFGNEASIC